MGRQSAAGGEAGAAVVAGRAARTYEQREYDGRRTSLCVEGKEGEKFWDGDAGKS